METILLEFVATLDSSLKRLQEEIGSRIGFTNLTINQFHYIDTIYELGTPTLTELAEKMQITKASVTAGINKLVTLGFATKEQSEMDKRTYHIHLTGQGLDLIQAKFQTLREYGKFIERALSAEEAEQLQKILGKLVTLFTNW